MRNWAVVRDASRGGEVPNLYCEWVLGVRLLAFELPLRIEGGGVQKDRPRGAFIHLLQGKGCAKEGSLPEPQLWG